ncbi:MAG: hypothetical protein ACLFPR_15130, partial [Desulfococcaceae bacterium]
MGLFWDFIPKIISDKSKSNPSKLDSSKYISSVENLLNNQKYFYFLKKYNMALISDLENIDKASFLRDNFKIKNVFLVDDKASLDNISNLKHLKFPVCRFNKNFESDFKKISKLDGVIFYMKSSQLRDDFSFKYLLNIMNWAQKNNKFIVILDSPNLFSTYM